MFGPLLSFTVNYIIIIIIIKVDAGHQIRDVGQNASGLGLRESRILGLKSNVYRDSLIAQLVRALH